MWFAQAKILQWLIVLHMNIIIDRETQECIINLVILVIMELTKRLLPTLQTKNMTSLFVSVILQAHSKLDQWIKCIHFYYRCFKEML